MLWALKHFVVIFFEYDFHAEPSDILSPLYDCITVNAHSADDCNQTAKMTDRWRL